jgi:hypothetical protein
MKARKKKPLVKPLYGECLTCGGEITTEGQLQKHEAGVEYVALMERSVTRATQLYEKEHHERTLFLLLIVALAKSDSLRIPVKDIEAWMEKPESAPVVSITREQPLIASLSDPNASDPNAMDYVIRITPKEEPVSNLILLGKS